MSAQSADWTQVVWREPQVRYLPADMTGSGKPELYRKHATVEKDPARAKDYNRLSSGTDIISNRRHPTA